jgi:hypothetical protein
MLRGNFCPSFARCCRSSVTALKARLRTFPDRLGDRGKLLLRLQVGKPRKPHTDHAALVHIHKDMCASAVIVASCDTACTDGNIETVWSGRPRRAYRVPPVFATMRAKCATSQFALGVRMLSPGCLVSLALFPVQSTLFHTSLFVKIVEISGASLALHFALHGCRLYLPPWLAGKKHGV